jgi:transcription termination factor NusB
MAGVRRKARIAALQALYEIDCTKHKVKEALACLKAREKLTKDAISFSELLRIAPTTSGNLLTNAIRVDDSIGIYFENSNMLCWDFAQLLANVTWEHA